MLWLPSTQFVYGTNTPHVFLTTCFGLIGAIFRYIGVYTTTFSLLLLSITLPPDLTYTHSVFNISDILTLVLI
jgi:hypothetical protein